MADDKQDGWLTAPLPAGKPADIDTSVAHPARVYDYWLGGKDNFSADREAGDRVLAVTPGLRERVKANRAFLVRAFFEGLDLVPPGLVYVHTWRAGPDDVVPPDGVSAYGGVARKP